MKTNLIYIKELETYAKEINKFYSYRNIYSIDPIITIVYLTIDGKYIAIDISESKDVYEIPENHLKHFIDNRLNQNIKGGERHRRLSRMKRIEEMNVLPF